MKPPLAGMSRRRSGGAPNISCVRWRVFRQVSAEIRWEFTRQIHLPHDRLQIWLRAHAADAAWAEALTCRYGT
jgi:hypothetical protein